MKKYTMIIKEKNNGNEITRHNSNNLHYLVIKWRRFFLTSTGERTTALLNYKWEVWDNQKKKRIEDTYEWYSA